MYTLPISTSRSSRMSFRYQLLFAMHSHTSHWSISSTSRNRRSDVLSQDRPLICCSFFFLLGFSLWFPISPTSLVEAIATCSYLSLLIIQCCRMSINHFQSIQHLTALQADLWRSFTFKEELTFTWRNTWRQRGWIEWEIYNWLKIRIAGWF